jgi:hypothetical protein
MKTFYSAEDIEALAEQGVNELRVDEETVITHLAKATAQRLGITLVYSAAGSPASRPLSTSAPRPGSAPSAAAGLKPSGCQHPPLTNALTGAGQASGSSDATVTELIGLVRNLADKGGSS